MHSTECIFWLCSHCHPGVVSDFFELYWKFHFYLPKWQIAWAFGSPFNLFSIVPNQYGFKAQMEITSILQSSGVHYTILMESLALGLRGIQHIYTKCFLSHQLHNENIQPTYYLILCILWDMAGFYVLLFLFILHQPGQNHWSVSGRCSVGERKDICEHLLLLVLCLSFYSDLFQTDFMLIFISILVG